MTSGEVQEWLDRYIRAWLSYDEQDIGELFSEDAEYRYHPADEPAVGRDAIVRSWLELDESAAEWNAPGTYGAEYRPWAVAGRRAVALGWSRYWTDPTHTQLRTVYDNCFLLEFDDDGRCRSFTEFYRERPKPAG